MKKLAWGTSSAVKLPRRMLQSSSEGYNSCGKKLPCSTRNTCIYTGSRELAYHIKNSVISYVWKITKISIEVVYIQIIAHEVGVGVIIVFQRILGILSAVIKRVVVELLPPHWLYNV